MLSIPKHNRILKGEIVLTASKSESNRLLLIRALCDTSFPIHNLAAAKDTQTMIALLESKSNTWDVGPAGTTMRFLTAHAALQSGNTILTGSERMRNRPIKILVDALRTLGADIQYMEKEGCPPLNIQGGKLKGGKISIDGSVSSQYLSALLMIAPKLKGGLEMNLTGKVASVPYLKMTLRLMEYFGAKWSWEGSVIKVEEGTYIPKEFIVEADWSGASYWYQMAAFASELDLTIKGLKQHSLQGDSAIVEMYERLGVHSEFFKDGVRLTKNSIALPSEFNDDFTDCPDVAQTLAVTLAGLGIGGKLVGLESLRIKETDRIAAVQNELAKFGIKVDAEGDYAMIIHAGKLSESALPVHTYEDHRMAMAFAPLAMLLNNISIEEPEVVEKSYPAFWNDLKSVGF
ncbi:MAG: 3-phosphoshikimate 1-carboxyvinyltransferase [Bacteroidetes bacterium]|nr:3-phosphoshikimate 1-carboxyvinyltransferase [Bacteroidota bacterium]